MQNIIPLLFRLKGMLQEVTILELKVVMSYYFGDIEERPNILSNLELQMLISKTCISDTKMLVCSINYAYLRELIEHGNERRTAILLALPFHFNII